jgi:peptidyl-dipeptidase A
LGKDKGEATRVLCAKWLYKVALVTGWSCLAPWAAAEDLATAAETEAFVARAEAELEANSLRAERIDWINSTYLTEDTDALAAETGAVSTEMEMRFAAEAARYSKAPKLSPDVQKKLEALIGVLLPAPTYPGAAQWAMLLPPLALGDTRDSLLLD